ncbi:MAG TPA: TerB family tellurite resistance protein [Candidatus Obscuribacterales bacterium]
MGWLQTFERMRDDLVKTAKQYNNQQTKEAVMIACGLMAAADGRVDQTEKEKVLKLIRTSEALQVFPAADLGRLFNQYVDEAGDEFARLDLLAKVGKLRSKPDAARWVMAVAMTIARADGTIDPTEVVVARELADALGLNADDYVK